MFTSEEYDKLIHLSIFDRHIDTENITLEEEIKQCILVIILFCFTKYICGSYRK